MSKMPTVDFLDKQVANGQAELVSSSINSREVVYHGKTYRAGWDSNAKPVARWRVWIADKRSDNAAVRETP